MQGKDDLLTETSYLWTEGQRQAAFHHRIITDYFRGLLAGKVLDIGERNPLTERLEESNGVKIHNTEGDLNSDWNWDVIRFYEFYDIVIMSHVIEHLYNPLLVLRTIKSELKNNGYLYIIAPIKPYWITPARCHFHEMDRRNFTRLITEAGFSVVDWSEYSVPIAFRWSIRNWLRRLYKEYSIVKLEKDMSSLERHGYCFEVGV
jgi:SAM-dependent methyltransferase